MYILYSFTFRYMRSLTFPNQTVYHRGRLSWANKQDVIIVSRALIDYSGYGLVLFNPFFGRKT